MWRNIFHRSGAGSYRIQAAQEETNDADSAEADVTAPRAGDDRISRGVLRLAVAKALAPPDRTFEGGQLAFWRSDAAGRPTNGGQSLAPACVGLVETVTPPVHICEHGLHATLNPPKWEGSRWWLVWLTGEIQQRGDKFAAERREILCEVTPKWD